MRNLQDSIDKINAYAKGTSEASTPFTHSTAGVIPFDRIVTTLMTNMSSMFYIGNTFNSDISSWDTSNVINMYGTFQNASTFNRDISGWNVSSVLYMNSMFKDAIAFNQDISSWTINPLIEPNPPIDFATGSGITDPNFLPTWPS